MADEESEETGSETAGPDAEQRAAAAERKLAFVEAGVDYASGTGSLLYKSYDGEMTSDAVKAAALEFGVLRPEPEATGPQIPAEEQESSDLRRATNTGAAPDDASEDPRITAVDTGFNSMKTKPREAAIVDGIRVLASAAMKGDKRVQPGVGGR